MKEGEDIREIKESIKNINEELGKISIRLVRLDERTAITLKLVYVLLGGTFGTLIGIILTVISKIV